MKISELLHSQDVGISCELFPPKLGSQLANAKEVVKEMAELSPSYMSITYGATGGTSEYTVDMANEIQNVNHIPALAHLTSVSSTREKVHLYRRNSSLIHKDRPAPRISATTIFSFSAT